MPPGESPGAKWNARRPPTILAAGARLVILGDGHPPAETKSAAGDFQARRGLAALVFAPIDQPDDAQNRLLVESVGDDLGGAFLLFHVPMQDRVQHVVGGKRILIRLIGAKLGAGDLVDAALGNQLAPGLPVDPAGQFPNGGLGHVADDRQAAAHVAVERAISHGDFALVAGGQQQMIEFVAESHEQRPADAGLEVFLGDVGRPAYKNAG